jgi:hypothetical protein
MIPVSAGNVLPLCQSYDVRELKHVWRWMISGTQAEVERAVKGFCRLRQVAVVYEGRSQRAASGGTNSRLTNVEDARPPKITTAIGPSIS